VCPPLAILDLLSAAVGPSGRATGIDTEPLMIRRIYLMRATPDIFDRREQAHRRRTGLRPTVPTAVPGSYGLKRWLDCRWRNNGNALYTFVGSLLAIGLSGTWAYLVKQPLVFPSLGATTFLIFDTPMADVGTPRNTIIGHTVGVLAGAASLALLGLLGAPSIYVAGVTLARVGAIALAVGLTGGVLRIVRCAHPPAGATTIIVASGLLAEPREMLDVLIGVLLLTVAGWCLNRLMGVPAAVWSVPRSARRRLRTRGRSRVSRR
jgi:CBS domain-containing membrane protein